MENEEQDFIRQLADKLSAHELPYKEGAWERFVAQEAKAATELPAEAAIPKVLAPTVPLMGTKERSLIRPWMGVAAALLLAIGAGWIYMAGRQAGKTAPSASNSLPDGRIATITPPKSTVTSTLPQKDAESGNFSDSIINGPASNAAYPNGGQMANQLPSNQLGTANAATGQKAAAFSFPYLTTSHIGVIVLNNQFQPSDQAAARSIAANAIASISGIEQQGRVPGLRINPVGPVYTTTTIEPLAAASNKNNVTTPNKINNAASKVIVNSNPRSKQTTISNNDKEPSFNDKGYFDATAGGASSNKWNMGVMVVPALSNDAKLNMGYGVSVGYKLNNKLSLNSGLAYTAMSGTKNANQSQTGSLATIASSGRTLSSINASLTGLNVPLDIRYQLSPKIYIGTGVSAMAILSDKVERKYAIAHMQSSAFEANNGKALKPDAIQSIASNLKTSEVIPEDQVGAKDFAGFINFSFGFKQPLNKSKSISIEPFISVPMSNNLFNQNIKMTDGGVRIKLGL